MTFPNILPVYRRSDIRMVRGQGSYLVDDAGKKYLDFAIGIGVNALGHGHPRVVEALKKQADQLWHCSNYYYHEGVETLAAKLVKHTFADTVFFCSTGTEAVECAVKMARRYFYSLSLRERALRHRIITFEGGFHGRSFMGISAGGNETARVGYAPLLDGFDRVAFKDIEAVKAAITEETAGILCEPIQGEGGIIEAEIDFLKALRTLADEHGILLITDEVQSGMGRSGTLFAFEASGIEPDICATAKGIGNGFPLAACLATERVGQCMTPGSHGSTYGANPLAMAVGNAVLDVMLEDGFLQEAQQKSAYYKAELQKLAAQFPVTIQAVRGRGFMLGLHIKGDHYALAETLRGAGLLTAPCAGDSVIRLYPPLTVDKSELSESIALLTQQFELIL